MNHTARRGRRKATLAAALGLATVVATTSCAITVQPRRAEGSEGARTLLVNGDAGSPTFLRNFNPYSPNKRKLTTYLYEPLEVVNNLDGKETPFLATGHRQPDASTVVFTLRKGATWSDGKPFTAADVLYTFALIKKQPALDVRGAWQHITSVSAHGDEVTVRLKSPDVPAVQVIEQTLIVPEHIWSTVKHPETWTNPHPVGTGPYTLDKFTPNQYSLAKNPRYWQADKVAATEVVAPSTSNVLDVVHDGYDWAYAYMSDVDGTWVKADRKHNSYWFPPGGTIALLPNLTKKPFTSLDFRRGLSYALDRSRIADKAEEGYVRPAGQNGLLLPNHKAWKNPALPNGGMVEQNTKKALASFAKAGYTRRGGKLVDRRGKPLTLTITTPNGWKDWLRGVRQVQTQLTALGITVNLDQPQPAAYQQALNNGDFDLAMGTFGGSGSLFQDYNNLLSSEFEQPVGKSAAANFERFDDPRADALLARFKSARSPAEQHAIVDQLQTVMYGKLPVVSLFYGGLWGLVSDKRFTGWPSAKDPYASLMTWDSTPLLILTRLKARH